MSPKRGRPQEVDQGRSRARRSPILADLTWRQEEVIVTAVARGYFDFPRAISLTGLSKLVGVRPSTLSEILRSAERRVFVSVVGAQHGKFGTASFGARPGRR